MIKTIGRDMKLRKLMALAAVLPVGLATSTTSQAFDVVESGQPVTTGEPSRVGPPWNHRSSLNIPGTQTDIAFGGYVKLDAFYDFDYDLGTATDPFSLRNPEANSTDGRASFTAYESRLNFRTHTKTDYGNLTTFFEGHFIPNGSFNIRHAYGELGGFLAGQTWSNFMSFVGTTRTLALGDPKGYVFQRHPQLRYTQPAGGGILSVALEEANSIILNNPDMVGAEETRLPDLSLRYEWNRMFSISGVVRELSANSSAGDVDDRIIGYGAQAQVGLPLASGTRINASFAYGSGVGNYMGNPGNRGHRSTPDAFVDYNGGLEAIDIKGFGVNLQHNWTPSWSSSLGYSRLDQDLPDFTDGSGNLDKLEGGGWFAPPPPTSCGHQS